MIDHAQPNTVSTAAVVPLPPTHGPPTSLPQSFSLRSVMSMATAPDMQQLQALADLKADVKCVKRPADYSGMRLADSGGMRPVDGRVASWPRVGCRPTYT